MPRGRTGECEGDRQISIPFLFHEQQQQQQPYRQIRYDWVMTRCFSAADSLLLCLLTDKDMTAAACQIWRRDGHSFFEILLIPLSVSSGRILFICRSFSIPFPLLLPSLCKSFPFH
ncbi:hypothetical protein WR25_18363 [Diploscapter pachys]|uniref:Uncharacterized protein n=1 Tax=Diploscapter pachys TaxID=2018661 RepID=A0A2A2JZG4_9BILA|nr:hypothetical protein WR25_18363 [Diploscapter pachys]